MSPAPPHIHKPNRLIHEKSPYLLQHAYNPVDWYPWGNEAFTKAENEDKPIFLSIGYSTCYWCHVMEREVFEDTAIAKLMNEKLVCIKVDREERPDIDRIYMNAVQAMTGSGGWPMSVFMTPDRKPFFGGTYLPPKSAYGRPGFPDLVNRVDELWHTERKKLIDSGEELASVLQQNAPPGSGAEVDDSSLDSAFTRYSQSFDTTFGGFGGAPKFPRPSTFNFLLRYYARTGNTSALEMTLASLRAMAKGGMYDQLGGGFHRYSVDGQWRVPHFEKMLYDQAQLTISYLDAYQITRDPVYADVARGIIAYVLRDLTSPEGGFYSAEDAESALDANHPTEKEEGEFYLWKYAEIEQLLGTRSSKIVSYHYGIELTGNALHDPQHIFTGKNILYAAHSIEETAIQFHQGREDVATIIAESRARLFSAREGRPRPHKDDKIITAWNGLMISALAKASQILDDKSYLAAAERAAEFVNEHLLGPDRENLLRRYRDGDARFEGGLQDYAFYVAGLIDVFQSSSRARWLGEAVRLSEIQLSLFRDSSAGGFFDATANDPTLLARTKEDYDGAEPTGNSVAAMNFLRLARITDNAGWNDIGEKTISAFASRLHAGPETLPEMLSALSWRLSTPNEIIIAGSPDSSDTRDMLRAVHERFLPFAITLLADGGNEQETISSYLPFVKDMKPHNGKATAYICTNYACSLPSEDLRTVCQLLDELVATSKPGLK